MNTIEVNIYTPQELNHSSYIQTGLFELEKESFIKANIILSFSKRLGTIKVSETTIFETNKPHPKTSFYQLTDEKSGRKINFATDLYDASNSFSKYALEHCDFVFKRNFENQFIEKLPKEYQKKIFPLGLTFKVHSENRKGSLQFLLGILITNVLLEIKFDRLFLSRILRNIKKQLQHWRQVKNTNLIHSFEQSESYSANTILFQTRCFPFDDQQDVQQIHQQRHDLVLLLRDKFKDAFKGGIIPSEMANKKYSAALTNLPTDSKSYLNLIKESKIVIYTRGLLNSPAWKMAEYLSQGKVIIAEKLTAELPVSLVHGKEILFFENEKELLLLIEEVMNNESLSEELSENAKIYFENHVHPKQNMKRIINFMLAQH